MRTKPVIIYRKTGCKLEWSGYISREAAENELKYLTTMSDPRFCTYQLVWRFQ
jgi:hypothetical protein